MKKLTIIFKLLNTFLIFILFYLGNSIAQDSWSQGADMLMKRGGHTVATLNGKIYAIGGFSGSEEGISNVEEYDPETDTWTTKADMIGGRGYSPASPANGKIYVIGGWSDPSTFSTLQEYDPETDTWALKNSIPTARWGPASCVVNGSIYVIGGAYGWPVEFIETTEVYNPWSNTWKTKASIPTSRWCLSCSVVNGKIYAIGGKGITGFTAVSTVEEYDPVTNKWTTKSPMPTARWGLSTAVVNGKIYAIGGAEAYPPSVAYTMVEEYDPVSDTWTTKSSLPDGRVNIAACAVNGKIYASGGFIVPMADNMKADHYIYDPGITGIENEINPDQTQFHIKPNPFSTSTTIEYELKHPETVRITFYNQFGKEVDRIEQKQAAGKQQVVWTPELPGGVYYFRLEAEEQTASGKVVLVR